METLKISASKAGDELVVKVELGGENLYLEKWKDNLCHAGITDVIREEMSEDDKEYYSDALLALEEIIDAITSCWDDALLLKEWNGGRG